MINNKEFEGKGDIYEKYSRRSYAKSFYRKRK